MERRAINREVAFVEESQVISGYAAVFYRPDDPNTQFELQPGVYERILPGAFDRAIREDDVYALFNHEASNVLGRTQSRTCKLTVDDIGLHYEASLPDTTTARDVRTLISRGEITGSSFAFDIGRENRRHDAGVQVVELVEIHPLYDVGPVTFPAYRSTTAMARQAFASRCFRPIAEPDQEANARRESEQLRRRIYRERALAMKLRLDIELGTGK